jgi:uncharacterized membrane protein YraQ (UPF0718 family)
MTPQKPRSHFDWSFWVVAGLSTTCGLVVWIQEGTGVFFSVFEEDLMIFLAIVPKVIAGTLIGALVRLLVARETIARWLGSGSGLKGLLIACIAGILIPAGPFTVFPLAGAMMVAGADAGAAIAFVTGWLVLGVNRAIVWESPFFGLGFVGLRMLVSFWVPLACGYAARLLQARFKSADPIR